MHKIIKKNRHRIVHASSNETVAKNASKIYTQPLFPIYVDCVSCPSYKNGQLAKQGAAILQHIPDRARLKSWSTVNVVSCCQCRTHAPFSSCPLELITGHRTRHHIVLLRAHQLGCTRLHTPYKKATKMCTNN